MAVRSLLCLSEIAQTHRGNGAALPRNTNHRARLKLQLAAADRRVVLGEQLFDEQGKRAQRFPPGSELSGLAVRLVEQMVQSQSLLVLLRDGLQRDMAAPYARDAALRLA